MSADHLTVLADRVRRLPQAEKLRLAAGLLDRGSPELARSVAQLAVDEIDLALLARGLRRPAVMS